MCSQITHCQPAVNLLVLPARSQLMNSSTVSSIKRLVCAVAAGCAVLAVNAAAAENLFTDATANADMRPSGVVLRQHAVHVNTDVLNGAMKPGALINFN